MRRTRPIPKVTATVLMLLAFSSIPLRAQTAAASPARVLATRTAPDEFGTQDYTVTTIGAVNFTPAWDDSYFGALAFTDTPYAEGDGFYRGGESGGYESNLHFQATVLVPAGAVLDFIGLQCEGGGTPPAEVQLYLVDRYDNITPIAGFLGTPGDVHTDYNPSPIGFQLVRNVHNQLIVDVETHLGTFGWVEIWWKRTVSPPPAASSFSDVLTTDPGFQYIEALASSGITGGCGGGNFCPDANLTRRQMAIFLAKALGLQWSPGTP